MSNTTKRHKFDQKVEHAGPSDSMTAVGTMEASNITKKHKLEHHMVSVGPASFTTDDRTKEEMTNTKKFKLGPKTNHASPSGVRKTVDNVVRTDSEDRNTGENAHHSATRTDPEQSPELGLGRSITTIIGNRRKNDNFQTPASQSIPSQDAAEGMDYLTGKISIIFFIRKLVCEAYLTLTVFGNNTYTLTKILFVWLK